MSRLIESRCPENMLKSSQSHVDVHWVPGHQAQSECNIFTNIAPHIPGVLLKFSINSELENKWMWCDDTWHVWSWHSLISWVTIISRIVWKYLTSPHQWSTLILFKHLPAKCWNFHWGRQDAHIYLNYLSSFVQKYKKNLSPKVETYLIIDFQNCSNHNRNVVRCKLIVKLFEGKSNLYWNVAYFIERY